MVLTLKSAMAAFGTAAKAKLANIAATGEPEEQLRSPFEALLLDMTELGGLPRKVMTCVGESALRDLKTRPDFAVIKMKTLVGFIELKAPGKGADPRKYKNPHDKQQWEKLQSLPNLIYTDGNEFSLCHEGEVVSVVRVIGDIESSGKELDAPGELVKLFNDFIVVGTDAATLDDTAPSRQSCTLVSCMLGRS